MDQVLSREKIEQGLATFENWKIDDNDIKKVFLFDNFRSSIDFVNKVASIAEEANHHPEIEIDYNKVEIELSTHSAAGVTQKDIDLASKIEEVK